MSKRVKFTANFLESLKAGTKRRDWHDSEERGLGVTVFENSGTKTFYWTRKVNGKPKRVTIGFWPNEKTVDAARSAAHDLNTKWRDWKSANWTGLDPFLPPAPPPPSLTLTGLFELYVENHLQRFAKDAARSERGARTMWKLIGEVGNKPLDALTPDDADAVHRAIGDRGTLTHADRCLQLVKTVLRWGRRKGHYKGMDITLDVTYYGSEERDRYLQPEECPAFFAALESEPSEDLRDLITVAIFTAARRANIFAMKWSEISTALARWTLPDPKNKRTNRRRRRPYVIPLTREVLDVLERRAAKRNPDCEWVFPDDTKSGHIYENWREWDAFRKRAKLQNFRWHDLRRTTASWEANEDIPLNVIAQGLGHTTVQNTLIYARLQDKPVRRAIELATTKLLEAGRVKTLANEQASAVK